MKNEPLQDYLCYRRLSRWSSKLQRVLCSITHVPRTFRFTFMCFFLDLSIPQLQAASHNPSNKPPVQIRATFMGPQALWFLSLSLLFQPRWGALTWGEQPFCPWGLQLSTEAGDFVLFPVVFMKSGLMRLLDQGQKLTKTPQELALLWANR